MVEVLNSAFIIDGAGTLSCYQCYQSGNRTEIRFDPKDVTIDVSSRLKA